MAPVLDRGDAVLAEDAEDAAGLLDTAPRVSMSTYYYAQPAASVLDVLKAEPCIPATEPKRSERNDVRLSQMPE
jgi:hypothetical protein